ncbi:MAG: bifunctional adenosylcobinamide kinase/adenosylcobinamide-phosphate guanylyltransferase [Desulfobacterales bacterium]
MNKKIFVLGGCRSGKSGYALETARKFTGNSKIFIATCIPYDDEMKLRVARHQQERSQNWLTVEAPLLLPEEIIEADGKASVLLVDCLTLWINNLLMENYHSEQILDQVQNLTRAVSSASCPVILVSNEVGTGIVPENKLARLYRDLVGWTNQAVAECVDQVVWTVAGIPVTIKGMTKDE